MANKKNFEAKNTDKSKDNKDFRKGKSKGRNKGTRSYTDKRYDKDETKVGRNDVSWYTPDAQLLNDSGRWPYSRPVGTPLNRESLLHIADQNDIAVPGLACAETYLTYGKSTNGQSALNVAANAVYTYVRHTNSGSRNYDANDLMLYIGALDSIYSFVTFVTRAYATVGMYASMNKYLPEALADMQRIDLDSIRTNMANFRARFNSLLLKIGTLLVPDTMPIFRRHSFMFQNYYSEGPSIKDQLYFYTLKNVYKFQLDSSGAGMLKNVELSDYYNSNYLLDADGIINVLNDLITPIFNDEDFNIMSGDILKAYDGKVMGLMLIPDLIIAQPINNVVALEQFKNIKSLWTNFPTASGVLDVTQDSNKEYLLVDTSDFGIYRTPTSGTYKYLSTMSSYADEFKIALDEYSRPTILTTEVSDPTPEVNMLNTRCVCDLEITIDPSSPSGLNVSDICFGSEIIGGVRYGWHQRNWTFTRPGMGSVTVYDTTSLADIAWIADMQNAISSFRFHPAHAFVGYDATTTPVTYTGALIPNLGIDNYTTIDYDHLATLHDVAILGEYNVPRLAVVK